MFIEITSAVDGKKQTIPIHVMGPIQTMDDTAGGTFAHSTRIECGAFGVYYATETYSQIKTLIYYATHRRVAQLDEESL